MWCGRSLLLAAAMIAGASTSGCGGEPFELAEMTPLPVEDAGFGSKRDDAETRDSGPDADVTETSLEDVAEASHVDVADASQEAAAVGLCCIRAASPTACDDRPWYCSTGGASLANCAAVKADGGSACQSGDSCGLVGGPVDAGIVGACR